MPLVPPPHGRCQHMHMHGQRQGGGATGLPDDPEKLAHLCMRCPTAPQRLRRQGGKDMVFFEDVIILRDKGIVRIMGRRPGCKLISEVMGKS